MDENQRRRLSLAQELTTWASTMPKLVNRIIEMLGAPGLSEVQARGIQDIRERVEHLFQTIGQLLEADDRDLPYDRLMALLDRLREEILMATVSLDRVLPQCLEGN
jgi:hypothetical protein